MDDPEKRVEQKPKTIFDPERNELKETEPDVLDNPNGLPNQNGLDVDVKDFRYIFIVFDYIVFSALRSCF